MSSYDDDSETASGSQATHLSPTERSARCELFRRWSLAWQPMDAETIDAYVAATEEESDAVLMEALRRLARVHAGPYRPAPAVVIDRCYDVLRETQGKHASSAVPRLPAGGGFSLEDRIAIWQRCIDQALGEGYPETSGRIRFWRRGIERLRKRSTDADALAMVFD